MRIKHNPIIRSTQNQKKYEVPAMPPTSPNKDHEPSDTRTEQENIEIIPQIPQQDEPQENLSTESTSNQEETTPNETNDTGDIQTIEEGIPNENDCNKEITETADNCNKEITETADIITDCNKKITETADNCNKEITETADIITDCNKKITETADKKPVSSLAQKLRISLPNRDILHADAKDAKPSASIEPYNYVKFETATGETFYFSKYFRLPPNLPPPKKNKPYKRKRIRTAFTDAHLHKLEEEYTKSRFINIKQRIALAQSLNLTDRCVKIWFQNRRMREKRVIIDLDTDEEDSVASVDIEKSHQKTLLLEKHANSQRSNTIPKYYKPSSPGNSESCQNALSPNQNMRKRKHTEDTDSECDDEEDVYTFKDEIEPNIVKKEKLDDDVSDDKIKSGTCEKRRLISRLQFEDDFSD